MATKPDTITAAKLPPSIVTQLPTAAKHKVEQPAGKETILLRQALISGQSVIFQKPDDRMAPEERRISELGKFEDAAARVRECRSFLNEVERRLVARNEVMIGRESHKIWMQIAGAVHRLNCAKEVLAAIPAPTEAEAHEKREVIGEASLNEPGEWGAYYRGQVAKDFERLGLTAKEA